MQAGDGGRARLTAGVDGIYQRSVVSDVSDTLQLHNGLAVISGQLLAPPQGGKQRGALPPPPPQGAGAEFGPLAAAEQGRLRSLVSSRGLLCCAGQCRRLDNAWAQWLRDHADDQGRAGAAVAGGRTLRLLAERLRHLHPGERHPGTTGQGDAVLVTGALALQALHRHPRGLEVHRRGSGLWSAADHVSEQEWMGQRCGRTARLTSCCW
mmetsp:Transcript_55268/g.171779  ORF Transcript_55268/g.171779 Transcript_55268/m.171779 type:complete len:209 (-) Transcript_55268:7-633(-)